MNTTVIDINATLSGSTELTSLIESLSRHGPIGLFLAAFVSNLIPGFPAVYLALVATYAAIVDNVYSNIMAVLMAGVGAGLGKVCLFLISNILASKSKRVKKRREQAQWIVQRAGKGLLLTIFIFAALPLPDDILYIPLGAAGYRFLPFLVSVVLGKTVLTVIAVFLGRAYRGVLEKLMGNPAQSIASLELVVVGALIGSIILSYVVLTMDWKKVYDTYKSKGILHALLSFIVEMFNALFKPILILIELLQRRGRG